MFERREDPALVAEPLEQKLAREATADDLDCHALPELAIVALGEVHAAHAARRKLSHEPVRSDARAGGEQLGAHAQRGLFEIGRRRDA
jgi:hypothetical protein